MKDILLLCGLMIVSLSLKSQELDVQGHRGARGLVPENTIPAFIRALEEGVTTLELDVVITKDKQVVISHEPYMSASICSKPNGQPVTNSEMEQFNIYQMTYAEVSRFDCGIRGNSRFPEQQKMAVSKPLLVDMIKQVEDYLAEKGLPKIAYNIELKSTPKGDGISHPQVEEFADIVQTVLDQVLTNDRYTIQCFDFRVLKYYHQKYPDVDLVALVENMKGVKGNLKELGFVPEVYSPYHALLSRKDIEICHQEGMKVIPWTVNDRDRMEKLVNWGVDGIITDYPDRAKGLR
ncbi:glycerophosphodiester phosphodiesterase family protein [uncultured Roseivirga sp.]|uniref:glycerophosphodiester phosphodiesterase family protein n=1 Tax=uncultured Roseivirga sp. TaxID=543088 RepID=UPI000D797DE5|nr:glycerophosphodiester phosphodiesterase family protein [uncultured Roseivirga sp.]PWL24562.1 MAG: glycerophosphodiester phosphodiesterase [Roseivirga sp. XM-24bin3]